MADDTTPSRFSPPSGTRSPFAPRFEPAPPPPGQPLRCAAIVPAYNEAGRITNVLKSISQAQTVDEIVVVTDGCEDTTADEARGFAARFKEKNPNSPLQIRVLELEQNLGKGGAMRHGALHCTAPILLFLDADLIGLEPHQVDDLLAPMRTERPEERADMALGLFGAARGGIVGWWLSVCHRKVAAITGQRAIRRDVFLAVPGLTESRFGVETAITRYVRHAWKLKVAEVFLDGVTHPLKEEKIGIWRGARHRAAMYTEIVTYIVVDNVRHSASSRRRAEVLLMRERFSGGSDER